MKIALLSDIHANMPAFEAVLTDLDARVYIGDSGPSVSLEDGPLVSVIPGQQL